MSLIAGTGLAGGCAPGDFADGCAGDAGPPAAASEGSGRPERIAINRDSFAARHIGRTADGRQFFLTTPFDPGTYGTDTSREFVALYLFAQDGKFLEAKIDDVGSRERLDSAEVKRVYQARLAELGKVKFGRIEVEPFAVERFGLAFGLIAEAPTSEDDMWWVTAEPGNYMAFSAPWDCGVYDT
ncbi:hypothetical protein [Krasilnikovia cinnamomea]|nr:hypothetical protein [Krasilnikovia cinnamomea]